MNEYIYEIWFKDKNGNGIAYQGTDIKEAKKQKKIVEEDLGQPPYFVEEVRLLTHKNLQVI